jgi:hypothetical protein
LGAWPLIDCTAGQKKVQFVVSIYGLQSWISTALREQQRYFTKEIMLHPANDVCF